jgi:hypothetical protein
MGAYTEQLIDNLKQFLQGSGWSAKRYTGEKVRGIHLMMPEGMEMSEPFQQRIWDILEQLPEIIEPAERVCISIQKPEWGHYYQTIINPKPDDFKTVGTLHGHVTKEEWEAQKARGFAPKATEPQ